MNAQTTIMRWRVCPRYPTHEVSDCGDLRRRGDLAQNQAGRRLRGIIDADGYVSYAFKQGVGEDVRATAHRMVAEAFIGPPPSECHEVAHRNGSKLLNTPNNLRWSLPVENRADQVVHGTDVRGMHNGRATITDDDVRYIRRRYREIKAERGRVAELDEEFGLNRSQIIRIARRQAWKHVSDSPNSGVTS